MKNRPIVFGHRWHDLFFFFVLYLTLQLYTKLWNMYVHIRPICKCNEFGIISLYVWRVKRITPPKNDNWCFFFSPNNWQFVCFGELVLLTFKRHFKSQKLVKKSYKMIFFAHFFKQLLYFLLKYGQNLHEVEGLKSGMDVIKSFRNC